MRKKVFQKNLPYRYITKMSSASQSQPPKNLENKTLFHTDISKLDVYFTMGKDYLSDYDGQIIIRDQ